MSPKSDLLPHAAHSGPIKGLTKGKPSSTNWENRKKKKDWPNTLAVRWFQRVCACADVWERVMECLLCWEDWAASRLMRDKRRRRNGGKGRETDAECLCVFKLHGAAQSCLTSPNGRLVCSEGRTDVYSMLINELLSCCQLIPSYLPGVDKPPQELLFQF